MFVNGDKMEQTMFQLHWAIRSHEIFCQLKKEKILVRFYYQHTSTNIKTISHIWWKGCHILVLQSWENLFTPFNIFYTPKSIHHISKVIILLCMHEPSKHKLFIFITYIFYKLCVTNDPNHLIIMFDDMISTIHIIFLHMSNLIMELHISNSHYYSCVQVNPYGVPCI